MIQLNKEAYTKLIEQDIEYLMRQERTLERDHIIDVLKDSVLNYPDDVELYVQTLIKKNKTGKLTTCQAAIDGECIHPDCPQIRDGEPYKTGRHCPLPHWTDDPEY